MAKIKEVDDLDDLNFDDLGDFDDFGGFDDMEPTTGKRQVFSRLLGGFKDGVKASFTDPKNHRTVIKEALPKGYSRIYDSAEFALESTSELMNEARRGYGQNKDQMKKAMRELLPSFGEGTSSTKIGQRLKNWSEDIRAPDVHEEVDQEQALLTTELGDVFNNANGAAVGRRNSPEDRARKEKTISEGAQRKLMEHASRTSQILSDRVGIQTSQDMLRHMSGMHSELQRLTAYQDQVTNAYQRKSLEIKYRHYFVSRKSLDVMMQSLELSKASYDKLIVNTSLPEAVKIQSSEHAQMILREKFLGDVIQPASASFATVGRRIVQKGKLQIQNFFKELGSNLGNLTDTTASLLGPDSGLDPLEVGGDIAGQAAGAYGMKRLAGKASRFLGQNEKLARLGSAGAGLMNNGGRVFQSMLKNDTGIKMFEWLKGTGFLDEFAYRRDETIRKDASSMLDDQAIWDQKSRQALTVVIPGLLEQSNYTSGAILAYMKGEAAPDMKRFNYASGLFEADKDVRSRIKADIFGEKNNNDTAQALRNFVAEFETRTKLSKKSKQALMKVGLDEALGGGQMNLEAYMRQDKLFSTDKKIQAELHKAFMENFYADHQEGIDDNTDGGFMGDLNRTFRRDSSIGAKTKLMSSLQSVSNNMGVLNNDEILKHMNVAGGNTLLDMGVVTRDGNSLKVNREAIDSNIMKMAMGMDAGYLASTLFDLEENENTLGNSVNSAVRRMIQDMDRRFSRDLSAHDVNYLRLVFDTIQNSFFQGSNAELLGKTDLDVHTKKEMLKKTADKIVEYINVPQFGAMTEKGQEYFKLRLDIIKKASSAARVTAPLKDFYVKPLELDKGMWGKSKDKALEALSDAGLDPEIVEKLKSTIKDIKDSSGKTVDMKLAELTGTKTYGEAARLINSMSDKGLKWLTAALKDPNTPPDPVSDPGSLFNRVGRTAEHLSNHSAIGRFIYKNFIQMEASVNNSYSNIKESQAKLSEVDRLAGNATGDDFAYDTKYGFRKQNVLKKTGFGVMNPSTMGYATGPVAEGTQFDPMVKKQEDRIVTDTVNRLTRIGDRIAQELKDYLQNGSQIPIGSSDFGPTRGENHVDFRGPQRPDIEIHHTGGIAGQGKRYGGAGDLFGNAPRYHTGGMVKGTLNITRSPNDPGMLIATLPNGQQVTIRSKTLTRLGSRASKKHLKDAIRTATREVQKKYAEFFQPSNPLEGGGGSPLLPGEVPAVLQEGEEVLRADDPRHRNNFRKEANGADVLNSSSDEYLQGILENTTVANQLLQAIVEKEFKGGSDALGKITDRLKSGWGKAKTKAGKIADGIRSRVTGLFGLNTSGLFGKVKDKVVDWWNDDRPGMLSKTRDWVKGKATSAWEGGVERFDKASGWMKDKAEAGWGTAKEIGEKLRNKIPSLAEIKKLGGVMVDKTWTPATEFIGKKYKASKEWWSENYPKFSLVFSGFWTSFKEKFQNWKPVEWAKEKGATARSLIGGGFNTLKEGVGNLLSAPGKVVKHIGAKIRTGFNMLRGFMSGGAWAAMKYRDVEGITDEVSGLRQVYLGLVDLQAIVMDRLPKKKTAWNDKDGDGKRDAAAKFMAREEKPKTDKDGNVLPGQEKKTTSLLGSIFGTSLIGMAIKALIGGIVGETMSNLFGFDLGLVGNTVAGMAAVGAGIWGVKKAAGYAAGKVGEGAGALWNRARGRGGEAGAGATGGRRGGAASGIADMLGGGEGSGCGCCCNDDDGGGADLGEGRERNRRGRKGRRGRPTQQGRRGRRAGGSGRRVRPNAGGTGGARAAGAAGNAARGLGGAAGAAGNAGRAGGMAGRLGGLGGRLGVAGAVIGGGLALSAISGDAEASAEEKTVATSEVVGGMGGALAGAAAGAAVGSVVPVVGTVIGGLVGGMAGHWLGSKAGAGVGNTLVASSGPDAEKQALLESAKQKSQTGGDLTPEEKKVLEEATKKEPSILVTLIKYSPLGLAWFAGQGLMNLITGTLGIVWDGVKWVASGIGNIVGGAASLIGSAIGGAAGMIWNGVKFVVGTAAKIVGGAAGAVWDGVKWVAGTTGAILGGAAGAAWDGVKWVGKSVVSGVSAAVGAVGTVAGAVGGAIWNGTKAVGSAVGTVASAPFKAAGWVAKKAWEGAKSVGGAIAGVGKGIWNGIKSVTGGAFDVLKDVGGVVLAATGIGALLSMGSKLWNFLNKDENAVTRFRFHQYGLKLQRDRDAKAVLALEKDLLENVSVGKGMSPTIKPSRPVEEYYEMFGVDPQKEDQVKNWLIWYHYRFKPIFLSHVNEWNKTMRNTKLHDGDEKLGAEAAKEYLKNVHYTNAERAPYNQTANPFAGDDEPLPSVKDVNKAYEVAVKKVSHFPSKPLADMEKDSAGIVTDRKKEELAKEDKAIEKSFDAEQKKSEGGLWDSVKSMGGSLMDKISALNPMNFFNKKDENQMSGWDRLSNSVVTAGQEAVGAVGSFVGGSKSYASHELTLAKAAVEAGITNPKEVAMFIAQCAHETGGFKWLKELGNDAHFNKYNGRRDLGNGPSDGAKFKGRGYIHLTGRSNYTRFAKASGIDVINNPDLVSTDKGVAAKAAIFWWLNSKRARAAGQAGDVVAASKAVNGGTNGLQDRIAKWNYYSKVIGNDLNGWIAKLEGGAGGVLEKAGAAVASGASAVKGAVVGAAGAVGAAAVGVRAQTAGAVASGVAAVKDTAGNAVAGAKSALGIGSGNAAIGTDSTTSGAGKSGTPWMTLAEKQVGVNEDDHEGIVRDYHKVGGSLNAGGKTPWCASFVGWVLEKSGIRSTRSAAANSYDKWGQKLAKTGIPFGAIIRVRFKEGNHVAFCTGDKGGARVSTLGGNQSSKKGGSRRNGGEVTLSSVARSEIVSVSYPEGFKPSGGALSGNVGGAATSEAGEGGGGGAGSIGAMAGPAGAVAAAVAGAFAWKGRTNGQATYSEMAHLDKLEGKTTGETGGPAAVTTSDTAKKDLSANENKQADVDRQRLAMGAATTQIAGYGVVNSGTGNPAIKQSVTPISASGLEIQKNADLTAVKKAEVESSVRRAQEAETERVAKVNNDAKSRRTTQTHLDTQSEVVNIMRESLAEHKKMNQTLLSINKGIQALVNNPASLRGESKPKAQPSNPRQPTPPENVPVTMRV